MVEIIWGSPHDEPKMAAAVKVLEEFGVPYKVDCCSAHRNPARLKEIVEQSSADVFIAGAGLSAALPGAVAALTIKPVIGVPLSTASSVGNGLDALLSIAQMPPRVPVATVGIDRAENAGYLALEVLAIGDRGLEEKLGAFRRELSK